MRVLLQGIGVLAALLMLAVSAGMNWRFGYQLGSTPFDGQIIGGASVASDCFKALLPFYIAYAWRESRHVAVVAGTLVWMVFTGYSMTSAIGFSSYNRLSGMGVREQQADTVAQARKTRERVEARLSELAPHRPLKVVEAELESVMLAQFYWKKRYQSLRDLTNDCKKVIGRKTRAACEKAAVLRQELAVAIEEVALRNELSAAQAVLQTAKGLAVIGNSDTQVTMFHKLTGYEVGLVRNFLIVIIAIIVEVGSSLGIFLALGVKRPIQLSEESEETLALRYFAENVVKDEAANVQASEVHENYSKWVERVSSTPPMTMTAFGRWLAVQGMEKERINGRFHYKGVKLKDAA